MPEPEQKLEPELEPEPEQKLEPELEPEPELELVVECLLLRLELSYFFLSKLTYV